MSVFIDETYKRVEELINLKGLKISSFEEKIEVSNNSIGTAIRRKASFKSNVLNKILNSFTDVNPTWLLTGKGSMFLNEEVDEDYLKSVLKTEMKSALIDLLINDKEIKLVLKKQIKKVSNKKSS